MGDARLSHVVCHVEDRAEKLAENLLQMSRSSRCALCASTDMVRTVLELFGERGGEIDDVMWVEVNEPTEQERERVLELLSSEELFVVLDGEVLMVFTPSIGVDEARCRGVVVWGISNDPYRMLSALSRGEGPSGGRILFEIDAEGYFLKVSNEGLSALEVREGDHISDIILDKTENRQRMEERMSFLLSGSSPPPYVLEAKSTHGEPLWIEVREVGRFDDGMLVSTKGEMVDVSKDVALERELTEYEERLNRIARRSKSIIFRRNLYTFNYDYLNEAVEEITGYTREEHLKNPNLLFEIMHPEDAEDVPMAEGDSIVYRIIRKDGTIIWVRESQKFVYDSANNLCAIEGVITDITDLMAVHTSLRHELEEYALMLEGLGCIVVGIEDGKVVLFSRGAERCTCYTSDEVKGMSFLSFFVPEDMREQFKTYMEAKDSWEMPIIAKDGSRRHVMWSCSARGRTVYLFGVDITHYRGRLSEQLMQLTELEHKHAELEQLNELRAAAIRRVAHDLKTPTISLKGNLELHKLAMAEDDKAMERLDKMDKALDRLSGMVRSLRESMQADADSLKLRKKRVQLGELLNEVVDELEAEASSKGVMVELRVFEELWVEGDEERLWSVFSNILLNAITHTSSGGTVIVQASREHSRVHVQVKDTGVGMPKEVLERVFESFYSSAASGGGMGIGLYVAKSIVEAHGGSIWAESTPEVGTTFHVLLPLAQGGG